MISPFVSQQTKKEKVLGWSVLLIWSLLFWGDPPVLPSPCWTDKSTKLYWHKYNWHHLISVIVVKYCCSLMSENQRLRKGGRDHFFFLYDLLNPVHGYSLWSVLDVLPVFMIYRLEVMFHTCQQVCCFPNWTEWNISFPKCNSCYQTSDRSSSSSNSSINK